MKASVVWVIAGLVTLASATVVRAANLAEKVKVELESTAHGPGMEPGAYVCAAGHLHLKGTVQNLADVALGRIKVAGQALGAGGKVLGTATARTATPTLKPGEKAGFDLEFPTVTGSRLQEVTRREIRVIDAPLAR
jgi:hypothetical protein